MSAKEIIKLLSYGVIGIIILIFILAIVLFVQWIKKRQEGNEEKGGSKIPNTDSTTKGQTTSGDKQSIFNFMEFDTVDDNMIIQKDGTRFLMVVECQGINYDLMSGMEKTGVEEGFVQFLNTLRNPIQIYIQTRSVNLEKSISTYKEKLRKVEDKFNRMKMQYYDMRDSGEYTREQLDKAFYELTKQSNLYEYGRDIINDTERMSLNKSVLNKKFYIIIPYYSSELGSNQLDKDEIRNMAFSEIYTRAQALIGSIAASGVRGRILRTNELVELLYMAYNRDEAEVFSLEKAIQAGYNEINTTAPDVLDKKMREIDKYIAEKAKEKAGETLDKVISEKERKIMEKEENISDLIREMAAVILKENANHIGIEEVEESIQLLEKEQEEATKEKKGGKKNGYTSSKNSRGRSSSRTIK